MQKIKTLHHVRAGLVCIAAAAMLASQAVLSQTFGESILTKHNALRSLHQNTPVLILDASLSARAQAWAEHLLAIDKLQHSNRDQRSGDGENLYVTSQSNRTYSQAEQDWIKQHYPNMEIPKSFNAADLPGSAVLAWYQEEQDYHYQTGESTNGQTIGHFTQVVWQSSTKLGCGTAHKTQDDMVKAYVVCQYSPAGNIRGQYTTNVMPRKPGAVTPTLTELNAHP